MISVISSTCIYIPQTRNNQTLFVVPLSIRQFISRYPDGLLCASQCFIGAYDYFGMISALTSVSALKHLESLLEKPVRVVRPTFS